MELNEFISKALLTIIAGVKDAQDKLNDGSIVPKSEATFNSVVSNFQVVEFEVTVNVEKHSGSETKLNVITGFLGGGIKGDSDQKKGHATSLKFRIPISLPFGKIAEHKPGHHHG
jgi:hypothetical protein